MRTTAIEALTELLQRQFETPDHELSWEQEAARLIEGAFAAGFVVIPKEPSEAAIDAADDTDHTIEAMSERPDTREQIANFYRAFVAQAQAVK